MPKLVIKLADHTNPDPQKDRAGSYKRNMVIAVVDDTHVFGKLESKEAKIEMEILAAKRKTAELYIEVWRSQNANKRHGNI
jgi:hypothetical protein